MLSAAISAAVACTPTPKGLLAVERTETGSVRVLIAPCSDYDALDFSVFRKGGGSADLQRWAVSNEVMRGSLPSIELFATPPGWRTTSTTLSDLKGGGTYTLTVYGAVGGRGLDGKVAFTAGQLEGLTAGQVLVKQGSETKVVSRSEFMKDDPDRCTP
ncbi:hypothetical protein [Streptomyces sp. NPDC091371]|uniref:hypothetical protein n=1 Tax=Streptomyces sp. NPDC091371 TaxID=3155303 RepID=UPI0034335F44